MKYGLRPLFLCVGLALSGGRAFAQGTPNQALQAQQVIEKAAKND